MTHQCVRIEELGTIAELPPDSAERRDIEACPGCRALLHSYLAFLDASPAEGSLPQRAQDGLAAFLDEHVAGRSPRPADAEDPARSLDTGGGRRPRLWPHFWPRLAPVAAAIALVAAVAIWSPWDSPRRPLERGDTASLQPGVAELVGENISLEWATWPGADAYVVVIYGADFSERLRFESVAQTAMVIPLSQLPDEQRLAWRVLALTDGDVVATSEPGYISLP